MKKFLLLALLALPLSLHAQNDDAAVMTTAAATTDMKFGYVSYSTLLETMPDYAVAMCKYAQLEEKYAAETRRVEDEFNAKYEEFLDGQRDFAPAILKKRQAEIKELMEKNLAFKDESKRLLKQAETEMFAAVKTKLATAVLKVGKERGYAFILNTDSNTAPFINPMIGEDATAFIKEAAK